MRVEAKHIKKATAEICNVSIGDLTGRSRHTPLSKYRLMAYRLCREMTHDSYDTIGAEFGNRDHSTIMKGIQSIDYHIKKRDTYGKMVDTIRTEAYRLAGLQEGGMFKTTRNKMTFRTTRKETQ